MSGGVDSSVAAALLKDQGYKVIGLTLTPIKFTNDCYKKDFEKSCCTYQSMIDAANICEKLNIEHYLIDSSEFFQKNIIDNFVSEYLLGRTPNPCALCNPIIKWGELLKKADSLGAKYIATGHYARIRCDEVSRKSILSKGIDKNKDQSYFLWKLSQQQVARTICPLGDLTKEATRALAKKMELPVFNKVDSQEICFVRDNDYRSYLKENVPDINSNIGEGDIILDGKVIGRHKGYPFYTIGQRRGLGISYTEPLFVKKINPETNTVEVCVDEGLLSDHLFADDINLIHLDSIESQKEFTVKIRYRDKGVKALCSIDAEGKLQVLFNEMRRAIAPGQSVVLYDGDDLIGGGIIS
jgi:tRNA-uridine 2-sulfurtransferase